MVEKTQSAISILQQRQAEVANIRTAEELVAEVQAKANNAIMEVKQAALEEIRQAESQQSKKAESDNQVNSKEEVFITSLCLTTDKNLIGICFSQSCSCLNF